MKIIPAWCAAGVAIYTKLGGSRVYKCQDTNCIVSNLPMDRDGAAAQNILMLAHLYHEFPYLPAAPRIHHPVYGKILTIKIMFLYNLI